VAVGVAVGTCDALGDTVLDDEVPVGDVLAGDVVRVDGGTLAVPLYKPVAVGAGVVVAGPTDGEKIAGTDEEPPPLQADTDPESRTVAVAQPTAVSLRLLTFMRPPCVPG
jgi:hypothetical protein